MEISKPQYLWGWKYPNLIIICLYSENNRCEHFREAPIIVVSLLLYKIKRQDANGVPVTAEHSFVNNIPPKNSFLLIYFVILQLYK